MASDHISFQLPPSSFSQRDRSGQYHGPTQQPAQQQYLQQWDPPSFEAPTSFSSPDWTCSYNVFDVSTQGVSPPIHRSQEAPGTLLDLGQLSENQKSAVSKLDVQSFVKPVEEDWRPPLLSRSTNVPHTYFNNAYARSTGVMTEPLQDEETYSFVGSDLGSRFDAGFDSSAPRPHRSSFRKDVYRDDRSEISAVSAAHSSVAVERPPAGRFSSDSQVVAHNSKRRRSSQPLPVCSVCKAFWPKNRSDQTYVVILVCSKSLR